MPGGGVALLFAAPGADRALLSRRFDAIAGPLSRTGGTLVLDTSQGDTVQVTLTGPSAPAPTS